MILGLKDDLAYVKVHFLGLKNDFAPPHPAF